MGYEMPLEYYTMREQEVPGPTYHSSEMGDWDEDDHEAARGAMDNHIHMQNQHLMEENARLREHIDSLSRSSAEHVTRMASMTPQERRIMRRSQ